MCTYITYKYSAPTFILQHYKFTAHAHTCKCTQSKTLKYNTHDLPAPLFAKLALSNHNDSAPASSSTLADSCVQ